MFEIVHPFHCAPPNGVSLPVAPFSEYPAAARGAVSPTGAPPETPARDHPG
jgi:hypothetical protein